MSIELGFLERCEPWKLHSRLFPSKVGGKPAWLSLKGLPTSEDLTCKKCEKPMVFLCQVYAPFESDDTNFHRTVYVFICRNSNCIEHGSAQNIKVLRSSLRRENDFYSPEPPEEKEDIHFDIAKWSELCVLCGILADKKCSQCRKVSYCCKDHQIIDWKNGHKMQCSSDVNKSLLSQSNAKVLFPEWELVTEPEDIENIIVNEEEEMREFEKLKAKGKTGTLPEVSESDLEIHPSSETDKVFMKFKKRIESFPDQVLRYHRGGEPLLISKEPVPTIVPNCDLCGSERQFEFQIMPQMLYELKEQELDWGVLLVFTCKRSCVGDSINSYKKEYVFKQDIVHNILVNISK